MRLRVEPSDAEEASASPARVQTGTDADAVLTRQRADVDRLIGRLIGGARRRKRLFWLSFVGLEAYIALSYFVQMWLIHRDPVGYSPGALLMFVTSVLPMLLWSAAIVWLNTRLSRGERRAAQELADCDDPRCIAPLLDACGIADGRTREPIVRTLIHALSRTTEADAPHIGDRARRGVFTLLRWRRSALYRTWAGGQTAPLVVAALHTVGCVGDARALPDVRGLAKMAPANADEERIRAAAAECLARLEARIAAEEARGSPLMPASRPDVDALVRPAGLPDAADGAYLRPAEPDGARRETQP